MLRCVQCNEQFLARWSDQKFCNRECYNNYKARNNKKICIQCKQEFSVNERLAKFCSQKCWANSLKIRELHVCPVCTDIFETRPCLRHVYCSVQCCGKVNPQSQWSNYSPEQRRERLRPAIEASLTTTSNTSIELAVKAILDILGIEYIHNGYLIGYYPDFRIESKKLIIECDGTYWHNLEGAKERDAIRDRRLKGLGYTVVRLTDTEIKKDVTSAVFKSLRLVA